MALKAYDAVIFGILVPFGWPIRNHFLAGIRKSIRGYAGAVFFKDSTHACHTTIINNLILRAERFFFHEFCSMSHRLLPLAGSRVPAGPQIDFRYDSGIVIATLGTYATRFVFLHCLVRVGVTSCLAVSNP